MLKTPLSSNIRKYFVQDSFISEPFLWWAITVKETCEVNIWKEVSISSWFQSWEHSLNQTSFPNSLFGCIHRRILSVCNCWEGSRRVEKCEIRPQRYFATQSHAYYVSVASLSLNKSIWNKLDHFYQDLFLHSFISLYYFPQIMFGKVWTQV